MRICAPLAISAASFFASVQHPDAAYYPLRIGTSWSYSVQQIGPPHRRATKVVWRVTDEDRHHSPPVYQVWPQPMQADDEAMQLRITANGVEKVDDGTMILKFPVILGATWKATPRGGGSPITYCVLSVRQRCEADRKEYGPCVVIELNDSAAKLRTVTTYAYGIGPVEFNYYVKKSGDEILVERMTLQEKRDGGSASKHSRAR